MYFLSLSPPPFHSPPSSWSFGATQNSKLWNDVTKNSPNKSLKWCLVKYNTNSYILDLYNCYVKQCSYIPFNRDKKK